MSKPPDFSLGVENQQADAGGDGRTRLIVRPNSQAQTGTGKNQFFPVQLTPLPSPSRIGKHRKKLVEDQSAVSDDHTHTHRHERARRVKRGIDRISGATREEQQLRRSRCVQIFLVGRYTAREPAEAL